jgi:hypothetical protein
MTISVCEICGGKSGSEICFFRSISAFRCQYLSTSAPYPSSSTCCSYHNDKRVKPGNLKNEYPFGNRVAWDREVLSLFLALKGLFVIKYGTTLLIRKAVRSVIRLAGWARS